MPHHQVIISPLLALLYHSRCYITSCWVVSLSQAMYCSVIITLLVVSNSRNHTNEFSFSREHHEWFIFIPSPTIQIDRFISFQKQVREISRKPRAFNNNTKLFSVTSVAILAQVPLLQFLPVELVLCGSCWVVAWRRVGRHCTSPANPKLALPLSFLPIIMSSWCA